MKRLLTAILAALLVVGCASGGPASYGMLIEPQYDLPKKSVVCELVWPLCQLLAPATPAAGHNPEDPSKKYREYFEELKRKNEKAAPDGPPSA